MKEDVNKLVEKIWQYKWLMRKDSSEEYNYNNMAEYLSSSIGL